MNLILEKVAAKKPRKKKPAGGRKPKDVYAMDMSKKAPGTKQDLTSKARDFKATNPRPESKPLKQKEVMKGNKAKSFKPTLHEKVDSLTKQLTKSTAAAKPKPKPKFTPKKVGLIAGGVAGAGILAAKVRANRKEKE